MRKLIFRGGKTCLFILSGFIVLVNGTMSAHAAPASGITAPPPKCEAGVRNDSLRDIAAVCNQVIAENKTAPAGLAPVTKATCDKLIAEGASKVDIDGTIQPYATLGANQKKLRDDTEICIKTKVRGDQATKTRLLSEVSDPGKAGRFFAYIESPGVFPAIVCYHTFSRAQVICDTLKSLANEKNGGLATVVAEMDAYYAKPPATPTPAPKPVVADARRPQGQPEQASAKPATPSAPAAPVKQGTLGAGIDSTIKEDNADRNTGIKPVNVAQAPPSAAPLAPRPSDKAKVENNSIPVTPSGAIVSTGGVMKPAPVEVNTDSDTKTAIARAPAAEPATAQVVAPERSSTSSIPRSRSSTTTARAAPVPRPSTTAQANNYVSTSTPANLPANLDNAMSVYRSSANIERDKGDLSSSFYSSLRGGNPQMAMQTLRTAAISSSNIAVERAPKTTATNSSYQSSYNLSQGFSFIQRSSPSIASSSLPQPLVGVEKQTMSAVQASAKTQDKLVQDMRSAIYKPGGAMNAPRFDPTAVVSVNPRMIAQTANLSTYDVADVAGRVLGIPSEQLQSAIAAAQDETIKSTETAAVNPEKEAREKYEILKRRANLTDAQARMILPLIGGLSTDAKSFMRDQRSVTSAVIEEANKSDLNSPDARNNHNREALAELENPKTPIANIPESEVRQVFREAEFHPVVGNIEGQNQRREEVSSQGRVNFIVESLAQKYPVESIKQVWIVGPIKRGEQNQVDRYNTTAAVKTRNGWLALDSVEGQAVPLDEWVNRRMSLSQNQNATVFYRSPKRAPKDLSDFDRAHLGVNVNRGPSKGPQKIGDYFEAINNFIQRSATAQPSM